MTTPAPRPCTARPRTSTAMCWEMPAISRPAANTETPASTPGRGERRSPTSPPTTMPTTEAMRKALKGHAYQATPSSSATALGIAVPTAIASKAMSVTSVSRPIVVRRWTASQMLGATLLSTNGPTAPHRSCFPTPGMSRAPAPVRGPALDEPCGVLLAGVDLLGGLRDDGVEVTDDTEVGELEDRGLGVLVDGHDGLRGLHAGAVLDGTRDADGHVEVRRDGLAGLPDL